MDRKENDPDHQRDDAKTLVAALTNLMMDDPTASVEVRGQSGTEPMQPTVDHENADTVLSDFTRNSPLNGDLPDEERQTPPTPALPTSEGSTSTCQLFATPRTSG
jgi:hypothetical protein